MTVQVVLERSPPNPSYFDLGAEREEAVAALEDIDARYERDRDGIQRWIGPPQAKERLLARLHARRLAEREPLVRWLLQLRQSEQSTADGR
jgi:hypothetical protein